MMSEMKFDEAMKRLEEISEALSKEDLAMEKALELFEEGLSLSTGLQKKLKEYEERVNDLVLKHQGENNE